MSDDGNGNGDTAAAGGESRDYSHLFREESLVSDADLRADVARNFTRTVFGDEDVSLLTSEFHSRESTAFTRGSRSRTVEEYERTTDNEETMFIKEEVREDVSGGVHLMAAQSAESMIGGMYVNTIAGAYLRLAGWVDSLVWGGWAEADAIRAELSALMIRSHLGYAHAAGVRATVASRIVDDFQIRTENFGVFSESGNTYQDMGMPGAGVVNES